MMTEGEGHKEAGGWGRWVVEKKQKQILFKCHKETEDSIKCLKWKNISYKH